jgi:hypothetical protein
MVGLRKVLLALGAACAIVSAADATEFAGNSGFDTLVGGVAYGDDVTVTAEYGSSAAAAFPVYNFSAGNGGTTVTEVLANFAGRTNVMHITSDGGGLYQFYSGGSGLYGFADVFVVAGTARFQMCSGYCGGNVYGISSTTTGAWQRLSLSASGFTDELSLYASPGAAEFYLDKVSISDVAPPVPELAAWMMMVAGFAVVGAALRRRTDTVRTFA